MLTREETLMPEKEEKLYFPANLGKDFPLDFPLLPVHPVFKIAGPGFADQYLFIGCRQ